MRHIAIPARSVNDPARAYTTTGLGDRIHSATIGWVYGRAHDTPTTLHLTQDKMMGGRFQDKPQSWAQIMGLFPPGTVRAMAHSVAPNTEAEWLAHLSRYDPLVYRYGDYPGPFEPAGEDISQYFRRIPLLEAAPQDVELPDRFITVQWDAGSSGRCVSQPDRIEKRYGLPVVVVGGEAKQDCLKWSMKHIAYAISRAELHVGVDSAHMHMAQLYLPYERIHLYAPGKMSHHARRAVDNGARLNVYL